MGEWGGMWREGGMMSGVEMREKLTLLYERVRVERREPCFVCELP